MKKYVIAVALFVVVASALPAVAGPGDELKMTVDVILENEDELVLDNLGLNGEQKEAFLPLYREYQAEQDKIMANRIALIKRYMESQAEMSNADAEVLLQKFFAHNEMSNKLRKEYSAKFLEVLPATKVVRLVQIENKIRALIDLKLAESLPLVK